MSGSWTGAVDAAQLDPKESSVRHAALEATTSLARQRTPGVLLQVQMVRTREAGSVAAMIPDRLCGCS
jgi:hypothetical protein